MSDKAQNMKRRVLPAKLVSNKKQSKNEDKEANTAAITTTVTLVIVCLMAVFGILILLMMWWVGRLLFLFICLAILFLENQASGTEWGKIKMLVGDLTRKIGDMF